MVVDIDLKKEIDNSYKIFIDRLPNLEFDKKVAIITNPKVAGLHLNYLLSKLKAPQINIITLPDGEEYKNMQSIEYALDRMFDAKMDRNSIVIAFGGGVIGDMSGFIASIFLRGIDFIQVPTTLLSMVDSSVGGKTGINNKYGKNLIGAFHQPKAVYIDSYFLSTLDEREFLAGVSEAVKMAIMFDKDFVEFFENNDVKENIDLIIKKSVETKAKVVSQDEKEKGIRSVLNYGHTFGHVIEKLTNYSKFLHGEAVAIGMKMANRLAVKLGYLSIEEEIRLNKLFSKLGLDYDYVIEDENQFYEMFFLDKKTSNNSIKFIIPNHIGDFKIVSNIDKEIVLEVLREFKGH